MEYDSFVLCRSNEMGKPLLAKIAFVLFALACAFVLSVVPGSDAHADEAKGDGQEAPVKITMSAAGDCTLGVDSRYNASFNSYYARYGSVYFLRNVKKVFSKDDLTIVNFEGTLTDASVRASKTFTFKGPAKYVNILKKGSVEVVNLANNHSRDFLAKGFSDTKRTLKSKGIPYSYKTTIAYKNVRGIKMAFLGFNELDGVSKKQIREAVLRAKKKGAKIIVVSFHWGIEKEYRPNATQRSFGRYAIDCGASVVLGHHPHVLQGVEKYKGRYIVYSLGNFCFGGNNNPKDKDTMIFQQTFAIKSGKLVRDGNARVIPCSLSGKSYTNTFQPRVLSGTSKNRVMKKIRSLSSGMHVRIDAKGKIS